VRLQRLALLKDLDVAVERPQGKGPGGDAPEFFAYFFPGLLLFSLLFLAQSIEGRAMRDRFAGIHRRIAASPVSPAKRLAAEGLLTFLGAFASSVLVLVAAVALFGIRVHAPAGVAILLAGFCLFASGFVKFIFAGAKSQRAASAVGMVTILLLSLLGGGFAPVAIYPAGLARLAGWSPVGAASLGLVDLLALGRGTRDVVGPIAGIWGWALLMAFLGLLRVRRLREE
jgi:ABC-type multidrug transport system permease subunit